MVEVLARAVRKEKEIESILVGKGEKLFADGTHSMDKGSTKMSKVSTKVEKISSKKLYLDPINSSARLLL